MGQIVSSYKTSDKRFSSFAVHFQLEQYAERIAEQIAAAVHAAGAAVPTIAEGNQQFIFALVQQWGHIISLCTEVLVPR